MITSWLTGFLQKPGLFVRRQVGGEHGILFFNTLQITVTECLVLISPGASLRRVRMWGWGRLVGVVGAEWGGGGVIRSSGRGVGDLRHVV